MTEEFTNIPGQRLDLPDPAIALSGKTIGGADFKVVGSVLQAVTLHLQPGRSVYSQPGALSWMTDQIQMDTNIGKNGMLGLLQRAMTGESIFLVNYSSQKPNQMITFSSEFPGKIIPIHLLEGQALIAQRNAMMVAEQTVRFSAVLQRKFGAGLFGGEGFVLQRFEGPGTLFAALDGEIVEYTLTAGQRLLVDTGHLAMFEPTVQFDIRMVKGIRNFLFGGEGLFLVSLTGPGRVWLQTMPLSKLAEAILRFMPVQQNAAS